MPKRLLNNWMGIKAKRKCNSSKQQRCSVRTPSFRGPQYRSFLCNVCAFKVRNQFSSFQLASESFSKTPFFTILMKISYSAKLQRVSLNDANVLSPLFRHEKQLPSPQIRPTGHNSPVKDSPFPRWKEEDIIHGEV
jgi:hypothetical protein